MDAVGYQATASDGDEQPAIVLNQLIDTVRPTGSIGTVGLYLPSDPGAPNEDAAKELQLFNIGKSFEKGLSMGFGQANARGYDHYLRDCARAVSAERLDQRPDLCWPATIRSTWPDARRSVAEPSFCLPDHTMNLLVITGAVPAPLH